MADRTEKQRIMELLRQAGLWKEAEQYREAARQRFRDEGKTKQEAVSAAWDEMAEKYLPLAEKAEPGFQTIFPDGAGCFDDLIDPDYEETDDAVQMRDGYRWIADEFPRIVLDRPTGTVVDYGLFRTPPPMGLACNILETWAAKPREKRDGLYREIRVCLGAVSVASDSPEEPEPAYSEGDAYLDSRLEADELEKRANVTPCG